MLGNGQLKDGVDSQKYFGMLSSVGLISSSGTVIALEVLQAEQQKIFAVGYKTANALTFFCISLTKSNPISVT